MSIGFQADNSAVGLNESVGLTVVARNDSSVEVKSIHVEIKQVSVDVRLQSPFEYVGHTALAFRSLYSTNV